MGSLRVLFLCTGNSARSQMAEALLRHMTRGNAEVVSAGTDPKSTIHPVAKAVLEEKFNIDTSGLHPKHMRQFADQAFDYVITVCDRAAESCPVFPGDPDRIHWSFPDPALLAPSAQRQAFERIGAELAGRMRIWMALPKVRHQLDSADV